jgi:hypothetical protein
MWDVARTHMQNLAEKVQESSSAALQAAHAVEADIRLQADI